MAHTANDTTTRNGHNSCEYWGGHDYLITVLLGELPDAGTAAHEAARKIIQRSVRSLISSGAIERAAIGRRGQPARYRVILDFNQPGLPVDNS
jgi:hypothetical protein